MSRSTMIFRNVLGRARLSRLVDRLQSLMQQYIGLFDANARDRPFIAPFVWDIGPKNFFTYI